MFNARLWMMCAEISKCTNVERESLNTMVLFHPLAGRPVPQPNPIEYSNRVPALVFWTRERSIALTCTRTNFCIYAWT